MHIIDTSTLVSALTCTVFHFYLQFLYLLAITMYPAAVGPSCILLVQVLTLEFEVARQTQNWKWPEVSREVWGTFNFIGAWWESYSYLVCSSSIGTYRELWTSITMANLLMTVSSPWTWLAVHKELRNVADLLIIFKPCTLMNCPILSFVPKFNKVIAHYSKCQ